MGMEKSSRDYEEVLGVIGRFGIYQRIYIAIAYPLAVTQAMIFLCNAILTDGMPEHNCNGDATTKFAITEICNRSGTNISDCFMDACERGNYSLEQYMSRFECAVPLSNQSITNTTSECNGIPSIKCSSWEYYGSVFDSTVTMEFDLVCDSAWKSQLASLSLMGGLLFGSLIFGKVSDRFGRKPSFLLASVVLVISEFTSTFLQSYAFYCALQLVTGAAFVGVATVGFISVMENVSVKHRVIFAQMSQITFSLSSILLALFGFLIQDWRIVGRATSIIAVPFVIAFIIFIFESPRWLYANGNVRGGDEIVKKIAKWNSTQEKLQEFLQRHDMTLLESAEAIADDLPGRKLTASIRDIFVHKTLLKFTCILLYNWFVSTCVFYGLSFSAGLLGGNVFMNIFFTGLVEIPGYVLSAILMPTWGRRPVCTLMHILSAVSLICMTFASDSYWLSLVLFLAGKLGVSGAFSSIYLYTTELYPTPLRGIGVGLCSGVSRTGGLTAIAIIMLRSISPTLPYAIFGVLAFLAAMLVCCLPETKVDGFPDTIAECKALDEQRKIHVPSFC